MNMTPLYGRAKVGQPAGAYIQKFCADTGSSLEDMLGVMDDRYWWREGVDEISANRVTP